MSISLLAALIGPSSGHPRRKRTATLFAELFLLSQLAIPMAAPAAIIWNGPRITFTKADGADQTDPANQDQMTSNVWITRGASQGIYNIKTELAFMHVFSPADTEWATGTTAEAASLTYTDWETWTRTLGGPPLSVGHDAVVHLKTDDIYIDINFISWSSRIGGGFSYSRSTPSGSNVPPTVAIITPSDGAAFTAPASVTIEAMADDSDGSVTNVEFFDDGASLGSDNASPFSVTANLVPGAHSLTAVATDNLGATTTSLSVTVTVSSVVITNPIAERIPKGDITIELQTVADGMVSPLSLAAPDDGSGRMFIYDQAGMIWVVTAAGRLPTPMLDVRARLNPAAKYDYDERGLLGLATHPNFAQHPFIYTYTSESNAALADFPATMDGTAQRDW